ncbi:MAG: FAD-dependent thymidylate synthase [Streptococcus salivarius]|nr:FAD-dependent thymidylate synthase [Streptococcus salivarius]
MKLIKQSFEFINQTDFSLVGIKKHIERCARVSYKSEDKITDTSYEKFVNMLESRGHDRPLEFGTVYLSRTSQKEDNMEWLDKYAYNPWSKFSFGNGSTRINGELRNTVYVTTNYRVIKEHHWEDDLQYLCEPTEYHHKRYTVHMILDRGVMDEFRTHVGLSHLAESTRYVNYSKKKFGSELTFIKPCWLDDEKLKLYGPYHIVIRDKSPESIFIANLNNVERDYLDLIKLGWTPQQARSVLPLSIKSELISCGFEDVWTNFFYRRDAPDAHPMAQEIAKPMHQKFIELTEMK